MEEVRRLHLVCSDDDERALCLDSRERLLANVPPKQKTVLQAIAKEGVAKNVTSGSFIKKYNLNSASSVQAAIKLLLKNDIITTTDEGYRIYDYFFSDWLATEY